MMVELDGVAYHAVPTDGPCIVGGVRCNFMMAPLADCMRNRSGLCSTEAGAASNVIFLTREAYIKYVAARLTS